MKIKFLLNAFILTFFLLTNNINSQDANSVCGWTSNENRAYTMPSKTPLQGQYLRALILYVTFSDDNENGSIWNIWPLVQPGGSPPINPYTSNGRLIDNIEGNIGIPFMNRYTPYTYSDWFCQMSMGEMDFIGDEYYIQLPFPSTEYYDLFEGKNLFGIMNKIALEYADANINFANYDNWTPNGNDWIWQSDGVAEMIIIHWRFIPHNNEPLPPNGHGDWFWPNGWGGVSGLGISPSIILDGITIGMDNGITACSGLNRLTKTQTIIEHEICHVLGLGHFTTGLMTPGNSESSYILNPLEREVLGYISPTYVFNSQNYQEFTLEDFVESGDVLKISTSTNDWFWVANNQKKSIYDGVSRGSNTCWNINRCEQDPYCSVGKGLIINHFGINIPDLYYYDLESSDGYWNWGVERTAYVPELGNTLLLNKTFWNPIYGKEKYHQKTLLDQPPPPLPPIYSPQVITDNPCTEDPNGVFMTQDYHGSGHDAFNKNYDEIFSPHSNPNSYSYNPITNTGLTVRITEQNQTTGDITVRIYYNDAEALADCPPSKPKGLKHEYDYSSGNWCSPKITWYHNLEPDMFRPDGTRRYQVWRATATNMSNCPNFNWTYNLLYDHNYGPSEILEYIDFTVLEYDCANLDQVPPFGTKYPVSYKIIAIDKDEKPSVFSDSVFTTAITPEGGIPIGEGGDNAFEVNKTPKEFRITQNYPNPFNPITNIKYELPKDIFVTVKIYDLLGREIKTLVSEYKQAGSYIVSFNGSELSSGIYFYRIQAGNFVQVKKMVLLK